MRRLALFLVSLFAAAASCDADTHRIDSTPIVETPASDRFRAGDVSRYRFDWRVDSSSDAGGILPDAMPLEIGFRLRGELELRVHSESDEGIVLGVTITRLEEHAITMMGRNALDDPDALLARESFVLLAEEGAVRAHYFPDDAPPILQHVVPGLLAQADLRVPERSGTLRVPTGSGVADAEYVSSSPTHIARVLRGYSRFDGFPSNEPPEVAGRLDVTLDERRVPIRFASGEHVWVASQGAEKHPFESRTRFSMDRIGFEHRDPMVGPELAGMRRVDPLAPPEDEEARRLLAQRFADGLDEVDVEMAVHSAAAGLRPSPDFIVRATGRLRGWPALTAELAPLFSTYDDRYARSLVVDMLAAAGTPEAQSLLCDLLDDPRVRAHDAYSAWVQRFSFLWRPSPGSARFLLDEHERAYDDADSTRRRALLYPMGTVAARVEPVDPVATMLLRERLHDSLREAQSPEDVVAALGGMGNAGVGPELDLVLAHAHDESAEVRAQVASALRSSLAPAAADALLRLVADRDHFVARAARAASDHRRRSAQSEG